MRFTPGALAVILTCAALSAPLQICQAQTSNTGNSGDSVVMTKTVQKIDTRTGTGAEAKAGDTAVVYYTGWLHDPLGDREHGVQFDSSVKGSPFTFVIGQGRVIKGWEQGILGMKVGGKRTLVIPQELGYGARGAGNVIPPYATLIFDIELLELR